VTAPATLKRRRSRTRRLRDEGLSIRAIAKQLRVSPSTVHDDLSREEPPAVPVPNIQTADGQPVAGAGPGNLRAMIHGAHSEKRVAPLREKHVAALANDYPRLDDRRRTLLADRLARIEAASAWLDDQESLVRDENGEVYSVVKAVETWSTRAEQLLAEIEAEHKQARRFDGLGGYLEGDGDQEDEDDGEDD
jgi:DNA-binding transcriptional MerR regulator